MNYKLDTDREVFFYENDFYVLSNFSAFKLRWAGRMFMTSEHAYQWEKFAYSPLRPIGSHYHQRNRATDAIEMSKSAHEAFKIAESYGDTVVYGWAQARVEAMRQILHAKVDQHEYVRKKLLQTGSRILIEDSWRDDFWGWGPEKNGQNMLGMLWMELRDDLRGKVGHD